MRKLGLLILSILAMASAPLAAQTEDEPDPSFSPNLSRVRAAAAEMRADVLQSGELTPDWNVGSADPLREMGGEAHYLFSRPASSISAQPAVALQTSP